jgi:hypothetical protein
MDTKTEVCELVKTDRYYEINSRFHSNGYAQNNKGTVRGGDLYSVLPEVIKERHVIDLGVVECLHRSPARRRR